MAILRGFYQEKNKPDMPAFGRKSEAISSKFETMTFDRTQIEKTKPICKGLKWIQVLNKKGNTSIYYAINVKESKAKQSQFMAFSLESKAESCFWSF